MVWKPPPTIDRGRDSPHPRGLLLYSGRIRGAKRLANAVCRRDSVVIDYRNVQARVVPPGQKRLMKIGEAEEDGAAVAASANENNTDLAVSTMLGAVLMDLIHLLVSIRSGPQASSFRRAARGRPDRSRCRASLASARWLYDRCGLLRHSGARSSWSCALSSGRQRAGFRWRDCERSRTIQWMWRESKLWGLDRATIRRVEQDFSA